MKQSCPKTFDQKRSSGGFFNKFLADYANLTAENIDPVGMKLGVMQPKVTFHAKFIVFGEPTPAEIALAIRNVLEIDTASEAAKLVYERITKITVDGKEYPK